MAYTHGKNTAVLYGAANLSAFFNEATASRVVETAETTAFGDSAKTYIVGLQDGTLSLSGMFDGNTAAVDETLSTTIGADANDVISVAPEGLTAGKVAFSAAVKQTSYEISSPVGDVVAASLEVQADGGVDRAVVLAGNAAVTSNGTGASQDNTASSANGGAAYLHVTANTRNGSSTFKVQHSSDNTTFVDLATFTSVGTSSTTAERVVVSGTVNRYLRASHAPGGSTGSVTYSMTFARR